MTRLPGQALLKTLDRPAKPLHLIMDRAYEGLDTRQLALDLGFVPVVPPKSNRIEPWEYDRAMYKRRNEVERLFRRLKGFRRIFSRFEKTRCHVHWLYSLRPHHRGSSLMLTRPNQFSIFIRGLQPLFPVEERSYAL